MISGKHYKKLTLPSGKKVDEHRHLMEIKVGRKLGFNEVVHHYDETKTNNSEDNLLLMSRSEHSRIHAEKRVYGDDFSETMRAIGIATMPNRKLCEDDVLKIRNCFQIGFSAIELSKDFNISKRAVYDILAKKTWKHI